MTAKKKVNHGRIVRIGEKPFQLIPIRDVPHPTAMRRSGQPVHVSIVCRWIISSVRGARLESIKIGGSTYTSIEVLRRFADRLSSPAGQERDGPRAKTITRQKQIERASARLAETLKLRTRRRGD